MRLALANGQKCSLLGVISLHRCPSRRSLAFLGYRMLVRYTQSRTYSSVFTGNVKLKEPTGHQSQHELTAHELKESKFAATLVARGASSCNA